MIKTLIVLALAAVAFASEEKGYAAKDSYAAPKQHPGHNRNDVYKVLAHKQLAVNRAAEHKGAGTGTAYYEGVPGTGYGYGYQKGYGGKDGYGYGQAGYGGGYKDGYGYNDGYNKNRGYGYGGDRRYGGKDSYGYGDNKGYGYQDGHKDGYRADGYAGGRYHEGAYYNYGPHNDHFYGPDRRY